MKRIGVLLALFCVGLLAASFAFADDGGKGKGKNQTTTGSTSTSSAGKKCKNVSLKGTAAATTVHGHGRQVEQGRPRSQGEACDPDVLRQGQHQCPDVLGRHHRCHAGGRDLRAPEPQGGEIDPGRRLGTTARTLKSLTRRAFGALLAF